MLASLTTEGRARLVACGALVDVSARLRPLAAWAGVCLTRAAHERLVLNPEHSWGGHVGLSYEAVLAEAPDRASIVLATVAQGRSHSMRVLTVGILGADRVLTICLSSDLV